DRPVLGFGSVTINALVGNRRSSVWLVSVTVGLVKCRSHAARDSSDPASRQERVARFASAESLLEAIWNIPPGHWLSCSLCSSLPVSLPPSRNRPSQKRRRSSAHFPPLLPTSPAAPRSWTWMTREA